MPIAAQQYLPAVATSQISESPFNPRKLFDGVALAELAESVREHGVLSPVLVRDVGDETVPSYELVFGHRRLRAAKLAGLAEIPALLVDMNDQQALEAQVLENCQRQDVSPIEEAEGYLALHRGHGLSVADLAAKVGKSESHIHQRMKLADLPDAARDAVSSGHLALSVALAVARISSPTLRTQAAEEVLKETVRMSWDEDAKEEVEIRERMPTEKALRYLRARYSLRLTDCGWDLTDADLVPAAGACMRCPKRSLNAPMLFPDLAEKDDVCTDPDCHAGKREAAWKRRKAALEAQGRVVLDGAAAEAVVRTFGPKAGSGYVAANSTCYEDPKSRPWSQVLGKAAAAKFVVARDEDGQEHVLVPAELIAEKKRDLAAARRASPEEKERDEEQEKAELESDVEHLTAEMTVAACVDVAEAVDADEAALWKICAELLLRTIPGGYKSVKHTAERRGLFDEEEDERGDDVKALREALRTSLTPAQVRGLVLEMLLESSDCFATWGGDGPEVLKEMVAALKVSTKPLAKAARKRVEAERKAEAAAKEAKKAGKKGGGDGLKASEFQIGDLVTYTQGAGKFEATVRSTDPETGVVEVERCKDGKYVTRPAVKLERVGR